MNTVSAIPITPAMFNKKDKPVLNWDFQPSVVDFSRNISDREEMITDDEEIFLNYIKVHVDTDESNTLVLPSTHHYYYENEDLEGVSTVINMKKLNRIKNLDSFLHTVCDVLSPHSKFIGCFSDRKSDKYNGMHSRMYRSFLNFIDARTDTSINKKDITRSFESKGFKIIDMTEINGLTYFITQNERLSAS